MFIDMGRRRRASRAFIALLSAAFLAVAISACGSSDSSSSATGESSSSTANENTPDGKPIVIGSVASCTGGQAAAIGGVCPLMEAWADWTNSKGGINGHPVELIVKDDGGDPAKAIAAVKALVEEDNVIAIVGQFSTADASWAPYVSKAGVPVVGGNPTESPFLTDPNFYASGAQVPALLYGMVEEAKAAGKTKFAAFYCAEIPTCAGLPPAIEAITSVVGGVEFVSASRVSATETSYTAPCLKAKDADAEALYPALNSDTVATVAEQCAQQGFEPQFYAVVGVVSPQLAENPAVDGITSIISNVPLSDESLPATKEMHEALEEFAPSLSEDSPQWNTLLTSQWAGGLLFQAAAEKAGVGPESTAEDVKKGLYALKEETLGGFSGPLTFTKGEPTFIPCYFIEGVSDGEPTQPKGAEPTCIPQGKLPALFEALGG